MTQPLHIDDGSCEDCTAKGNPLEYVPCEHCGAECGHLYCRECAVALGQEDS